MSKQDLEAGKTYYWCSCGKSSNEPFCDGSHKGTDKKSLPFSVETSESVYLCGCKQTKNPPFCDGSHNGEE